MFDSSVISDFKEQNKIVFKGKWQGKPFEEKGTILKLIPNKFLQYDTFSTPSGKPDTKENYHTISILLNAGGSTVLVSFTQDNNESEKMVEQSQKKLGDGAEKNEGSG